MSVPATPTGLKRRPMSQGAGADCSEGNGSGSWLGAIGGVMEEILQSWGILGALKRRGWGTTGARSTPNTPPTFSRSASPMHEQIELSHLNIQCRESIEGGSSVGSPAEKVRRRNRPRTEAPRHSFYEGSSPDSYMLTTLLIHSLKHGSGNSCSEPHCHLCIEHKGATSSHLRLESHKNALLDPKQWKKLGLDHVTLCNHSLSEESNVSHIMDISFNPFHASCDSTCDYFLPNLINSEDIAKSPDTYSSCLPLRSFGNGTEAKSDFGSVDSSLTEVTCSYAPETIYPSSNTFFSGVSGTLPSSDSFSSCKETDASFSIQTDSGTLTEFMSGRTCCTSSFFGDDSYDSATLTGEVFDLPKDRNLSIKRQGLESPPFFGLNTSVCSLPSRLGNLEDVDTFERPVLSSGSLIMVPRRPSLSSPVGTPSSHFRWEEVRELGMETCFSSLIQALYSPFRCSYCHQLFCIIWKCGISACFAPL